MRAWAWRALTTLAVLLIALGVLAGVVNRELLDGDRFAKHVDVVRADADVSRQLGLLISDKVIEQQPDLVALRPLLESASSAVVSSPALGPIVRTTVTPLHRAFVSGSDDEVILRLADVGAVLVAAITTLAPDAQAVIPDDLDVTLAAFGSGEATSGLVATTHWVRVLAWLLPLLGAVCLVAAGVVRGGRQHAWFDLIQKALLGTAAGLGVLVLVTSVVVNRLDTETLRGALVAASWRELESALWAPVIVLGIVALAVAMLNRPDLRLDPRAMLPAIVDRFTTTALSPPARLARGLLLTVIGLLLVLEPGTVLTVAAGIAGVLVLLIAGRELAVATGAVVRSSMPRLAERLRPLVGSGPLLGAGAAAVFLVVLAGAWPADTRLPAASAVVDDAACNGYEELCDRRYDRVAFPATHNSMSAADGRGWFMAEQPTGVTGQLDDGIRVFLIDSWLGQSTAQPGMVANTEASRAESLAQARESFGEDVVEAALRLRAALDLEPRGEIKPYLCHAMCELGSTEWIPLMRQVKAWMDAHPRDVVTFLIQDEVPPDATAAVFEEAGLLPYIHTQELDRPWPTLEQMITSGERLVVLQEHEVDGEYPWMLDADIWVQDTPYQFASPEDFTCEPFRGEQTSPLFLVNHWLGNKGSRVADAEKVNVQAVLSTRLEQCRDERGRLPNFVAVDFYDRGDLFAAVEAINGIS